MPDIRRGIYILPSLFTGANLAIGFLSMLYSIENQFTAAAWAIMASILMDVLDGRVARMTNTTSRFGVEFDSLSDLTSFGIAPAVLMYQLVLNGMGKPGIAIALMYVLAGALRLARFNVKAQDGEAGSSFLGLPIPAGAGMLASFVLSYELFLNGQQVTVKTIPIIMHRMPFFYNILPVFMIVISILMISTVPYAAFKKFKPSRPKSLQLITLLMVTILFIIAFPQNSIFILFLAYLLSGFVAYIFRYWRLRASLINSFKLKRPSDRP